MFLLERRSRSLSRGKVYVAGPHTRGFDLAQDDPTDPETECPPNREERQFVLGDSQPEADHPTVTYGDGDGISSRGFKWEEGSSRSWPGGAAMDHSTRILGSCAAGCAC